MLYSCTHVAPLGVKGLIVWHESHSACIKPLLIIPKQLIKPGITPDDEPG